ncbi:MAG: hypothetical protein CM1200mP40_06680 [Gammaproteobacteria bacterium]|nr:MAG: hypothetical protein CM1200mP40_06680 [Gammaproteobacteria bacterium]
MVTGYSAEGIDAEALKQGLNREWPQLHKKKKNTGVPIENEFWEITQANFGADSVICFHA